MSSLEDSLDKLVQELSHGKRCRVCGCMASETHHIIPRANKVLRYDPKNFMYLCHDCHQKFTDEKLKEENYSFKEDWNYFQTMRWMNYKDFLLFEKGMTKEEYLKERRKVLRDLLR